METQTTGNGFRIKTTQEVPFALLLWLLLILLHICIDTMFYFILCGVYFIFMLVALPPPLRGKTSLSSSIALGAHQFLTYLFHSFTLSL